MKHVLKQAGYIITACTITFAAYSCNNNKTNSSNSSDSTSTSVTMRDTIIKTEAAPMKQFNPDSAFVVDIARSNGQEMQMLEAGAEQGSNKKLKADAKKMFTDHKKLGQQMLDYASKNNIALSSDTTMDMSAMNSYDETTFDTAWTQKMIDGHQQTIAKFEAAQNTVKDPELKAMITNTLPTLHEHLDLCQSLMASLKK